MPGIENFFLAGLDRRRNSMPFDDIGRKKFICLILTAFLLFQVNVYAVGMEIGWPAAY